MTILLRSLLTQRVSWAREPLEDNTRSKPARTLKSAVLRRSVLPLLTLSWLEETPMPSLEALVLSSCPSPPRMTKMLAAVLLLEAVEIVSVATEVLVNHAEARVEVAEAERLRSTTNPSQLYEPIPPALAAPRKVRVKYLCHAHAFQCGAQ